MLLTHFSSTSAPRPLLAYRWELVLWLWVAFFLNQADRQLFGIVLPALKLDLHLTDMQCGLVASLFTLTYACIIPFSGLAGDLFSRKRIVVGSILLWSVATALTGLAHGFLFLIVARCLATGIGEAMFAPSAYAMIGEQHVETRAQAMAIHQTSLYVGVVVTGALAGAIADHAGWRGAFLSFGIVGVAAAALMQYRLRDSRRQADAAIQKLSPRDCLQVLRTPTALFIALGLGSSVFANMAYLTWMPTYLHERFQLSLAQAGFSSMFYHHAFAFVGVLFGGRLADRWARRRPSIRIWMQATSLLLAAPFLYLMGAAHQTGWIYFGLAGFGLFRGIYDCNTYAALYQVVPKRLHATASGLILSVAFAIAATAPVLLGYMKSGVGLAAGLSALAAVHTIGSLLLWIASAFFLSKDCARAAREQALTEAGA
jgi:MFS family permease